jgi:nucleoside phosphorylase
MVVSFCAAVEEELGGMEGRVLGVGPVVAGISAGAWLAEAKPEAVVLLGTCGAYPGGAPIGSVVASARLGLGSAAVALGAGYVPMAPAELAGSWELMARCPAPRVGVLTVQAVSTSAALIAAFGAHWQVEHMEAFAVAQACATRGVPFLALLGVANKVGPEAHAEWVRNRERVQAGVRMFAAMLGPGAG